jgi:hypothetical protein
MSKLVRLAERCEQAAGPSFDLDKEILKALGFTWRGMNYWSADNETMWKGTMTFTHSIDAAITLIPDGFCLASLGFCEGDEYQAGWHCELVSKPEHYVFVGLDDPMNFHREDPRRIKTPALALCAAALRARSSANSPAVGNSK